jgi:hypothetical protein
MASEPICDTIQTRCKSSRENNNLAYLRTKLNLLYFRKDGWSNLAYVRARPFG